MTNNESEINSRCGYVSLLGAPNVGKSTLLNQLVGAKISIVSRKVQTTRRRVLGILVHEQTQIILVDTPGIFTPKRRLDKAMIKAAWSSLKDSDVTVLMVDASKTDFSDAYKIMDQLQERETPFVLVLNKVDQIKREELLKKAQDLTTGRDVLKVFMISALNGDGIKELTDYLSNVLPSSPWLYPEDQITDLPLMSLASEVSREKVYHYLHKELPYSIDVETEKWEKFDNGDLAIHQVIHVLRDSQKPIVLGKKGAQIRQISMASRNELEELFDCKVHLYLRVKVSENWMNNPEHYRNMGLQFQK